MDSNGTLKIKLQYKEVLLLEEDVVAIPFNEEYDSEVACLKELRNIKAAKRDEAQKLEIERLHASTKAERIRQETQQTREAVAALHRGMEVDCTSVVNL